MADDLRVLSYNIHSGYGVDGRLDLARVGDVVRRTDADLVGLQEVDRHRDRSDRVDQVAFLADYLDMNYEYGLAIEDPPGDGGTEPREYGIAVLSRYPIASAELHDLYRDGDTEPRVLLVTRVDAGDGDRDSDTVLSFATTHLGLDEAVRRRQASDIVDALGPTAERTLLTGDFNARPDSEPIRTVTDVFEDALEQVESGDPRTFPTPYVDRDPSDDAVTVHEPDRRIDYVFHSPDVAPVGGRVVESLASDHSAVLVEVTTPD